MRYAESLKQTFSSCSSCSDIDIIVHSKEGRSWSMEELEALMLVLREAFCRHCICTQEGIQIISGATVPIIKLTDRKTDVKVDMSFNMNNGLRSAQLVLVRIRRNQIYRLWDTKTSLRKSFPRSS